MRCGLAIFIYLFSMRGVWCIKKNEILTIALNEISEEEAAILEEYQQYLKSIVDTEKSRKARYEKRKNKRDRIRRELNRQLEDQGTSQIHYKDLVLDYMSLWDIKNELIHDIKVKGVSNMYKNGQNQWGFKKNDSISELNKVNNQMLKILNDLNLKPIDLLLEEGEEDEEFSL